MSKYQEPRKCHDCFWARLVEDRVKFECHYHAPSCLHGVGNGYESLMWPVMSHDDFCSKFAAKTLVGGGMI